MFSFTYQSTPYSQARLGKITTPHGDVQTPAFIFCATKAAMKGLTADQMRQAGTQIILSNTYHLSLQPGAELIEKMGGLQKFTGWKGPMLTDSGGFQIFSLGHGSVASEVKGKRMGNRSKTLLKITEEGARFRSYWDGRIHLLTPEESIRIQRSLGADLILVLDECTPYHVDKSYTARSMELSHRWAMRSLKEFKQNDTARQQLYGIIQGGIYPDLRQQSCDFVNSQPFFGHAVGGCLGGDKSQMQDVVSMAAPHLDLKRPVHLLGIGGITDILQGVEKGIDTFDCVHPTRLARHGGALVRPDHNPNPLREHINLRNHMYQQDNTPIEPDCPCYTCTNYSKSYLNHLLKAQEMVSHTLISLHNVQFINRLMAAIRQSLTDQTFDSEKKRWVTF